MRLLTWPERLPRDTIIAELNLMGSFFLILLMSFFLFAVFLFLFIWSARKGQYDDLKTPPHRLLTEDLDELKPLNRNR